MAYFEVSPQELFDLHVSKAEEVASRLCYYYAVSGALNYRDEAASEAKMALWKCCCRFDPAKQKMQIKQEAKRIEEVVLSCIFGYDLAVPVVSAPSEPYKNFWIASIQRVRGSVIDMLRAERLIIKPVINGELATLTRSDIREIKRRLWSGENQEDIAIAFGISQRGLEKLKPTMLHQERFLSLDRQIGEACNTHEDSPRTSNGQSFVDRLTAKPDIEEEESRTHVRTMLEMLKQNSMLNAQEKTAVELFYNEEGYSQAEVAKQMNVSTRWVKDLLAVAIVKMRQTSFPVAQ